MQEIYRRWLTLPGNVRGSLIVLLASLISVLMTSLIKHVGQSIPVVEILFIRQILVLVIISPVILKNIDTVFKTKVLRLHVQMTRKQYLRCLEKNRKNVSKIPA